MKFVIQNEPFGYVFAVGIDEPGFRNKEFLIKYLKKNGLTFELEGDMEGFDKMYAYMAANPNSHATSYFPVPSIGIIFFNKPWKDLSYDYGVLAHEIFHCVVDMLAERDIKHSPETEEVFAYNIGWLTRHVIDKLWELQQKEKKLSLKQPNKDDKRSDNTNEPPA